LSSEFVALVSGAIEKAHHGIGYTVLEYEAADESNAIGIYQVSTDMIQSSYIKGSIPVILLDWAAPHAMIAELVKLVEVMNTCCSDVSGMNNQFNCKYKVSL
jgi:hypothetical protein